MNTLELQSVPVSFFCASQHVETMVHECWFYCYSTWKITFDDHRHSAGVCNCRKRRWVTPPSSPREFSIAILWTSECEMERVDRQRGAETRGEGSKLLVRTLRDPHLRSQTLRSERIPRSVVHRAVNTKWTWPLGSALEIKHLRKLFLHSSRPRRM